MSASERISAAGGFREDADVRSARLSGIPPYLYAEIDEKLSAMQDAGVDVISFGAGDPDFPTPPHIVEALRAAVLDPGTHHYPSYFGLPEFREAIAEWFEERFRVALDPDGEVLPLLGTKEGIIHLPLALVDRGDIVLCSNPAYPAYFDGALLAGAEAVPVPCVGERGFLPDLHAIDAQVLGRAKILWLNLPGNPTGATADLEFFEEAVEVCRRHGILLAHDAAYSEIAYDDYVAPSVLQVPDARDVAVEFHSFSKTYCMTGWRVGWVCGRRDVIDALGDLKTHIDSGIFNAVQRASVAALRGPRDFLQENLAVLASRRDRAVDALNALGMEVRAPRGSLYLWVPVPDGETSSSFSTQLLEEAAVFLTPGTGYGAYGEGYVRLSLCLRDRLLDEGLNRIASVVGKH